MGTFLRSDEIRQEQFEWGAIGWRCTPGTTGARQAVVMDVSILPGAGHDFHRHPTQEELIIVDSGEVEQWLGDQSMVLRPGDSAYVDPGLVHASFNAAPETARLRVVISPSVDTPTGYDLEDVSAQEPWVSLRQRTAAPR
jgi:quercetin dioxygenase-like cupin family protein